MMVLRLIVLVILLYIGWRLLKAIAGRKKKEVEQAGTGDGRVEDILVEDPVCHTLVPKSQAVRLRKDHATYYFCSEKCADSFNENSREKE